MIYFIRAGAEGPVKIGLTKNVPKRLETLQTANHETLQVIRVYEGDCRAEMWFQRQFENYALRGEWFHYNDAMLTLTPTSNDLVVPKTPPKIRYSDHPGRRGPKPILGRASTSTERSQRRRERMKKEEEEKKNQKPE